MLIVVENGDIHLGILFQAALDLKAAGRGNILQIHAAEAAGEQFYRVDDIVHVFAADAERNGVHVAEGLEEHRFPLHDGHTRFRADIAQPQNRGAVRHHRDGVPAAGQLERLVIIPLYFQAGLCDARRISQRKVRFVLDLDAGDHLHLAPPFGVFLQ